MHPMEKVIVGAYVDKHENQDEEEEGILLVEMHPNLPLGYGCVLAPMIADVANNTMVPVCLFNPQSYLVIVRQDSLVGEVEPVDAVSTISRY